MAKTPSTMTKLGTKAPNFELPGTDGKNHSLGDFSQTKGLLVAFLCNHCPFVIHIRSAFLAYAREFISQGLGVAVINSNDAIAYPADNFAAMRIASEQLQMPFPYLFDESQAVAKAYQAACTPDFFLYDSERTLVYRGRFDASTPGNGIPATGQDLRAATVAVLAGEPVSSDQLPSIGCNIKWKPGAAPEYFAP